MDVELPVPTLARFDAACEALGADPEAVRSGEETVQVPEEPAPVLDAMGAELDVEEDFEQQAARAAVQAWLQEAMRSVTAAAQQAAEQADAAGVREVMQHQGGPEKPLSRVLSTLPATDYDRIYHDWHIERALRYLMLRSVDHVSENLEDFI